MNASALAVPAEPGWTRELTRRVDADPATVFSLIAEVELWPAIFRHIRSARVLRRDGRRRLVVVKARWRGLPLGYTAVQTVDNYYRWTSIRHLSRLTAGSVATFSVPVARTTGAGPAADVHVKQSVTVPIPLVGDRLARAFIGGRVARELGDAMLDRVKEIAEGGSLADRR